MNNWYSWANINASPLQAWRAGFREGVKMGLENGDVVDPSKLKEVHSENYRRMLVWMTVGEDAKNGLWAIYGARLGCYMTNVLRHEWDWKNVRDFDWLSNYFNNELAPKFSGNDNLCLVTGYSWSSQKLQDEINRLGEELQQQLKLEIANIGSFGSKFFKAVYKNPSRLGPMIKEIDINEHI